MLFCEPTLHVSRNNTESLLFKAVLPPVTRQLQDNEKTMRDMIPDRTAIINASGRGYAISLLLKGVPFLSTEIDEEAANINCRDIAVGMMAWIILGDFSFIRRLSVLKFVE